MYLLEFNLCFNIDQNIQLGFCFSLLKLKRKPYVFIAIIDNCVDREGKALSYYCSETRISFER